MQFIYFNFLLYKIEMLLCIKKQIYKHTKMNLNVDWTESKFMLHKAIHFMNNNFNDTSIYTNDMVYIPNDIIAALNESEPDVVNAQNSELYNDTPFHLLIKYVGNFNDVTYDIYNKYGEIVISIAKYLLNNYNINFTLKNNEGLTAIELAQKIIIGIKYDINHLYVFNQVKIKNSIKSQILIRMVSLIKNYIKKNKIKLIKQNTMILANHFHENIYENHYHYGYLDEIFDFIDALSW
jgi:hypothetical protein